MSFERKLAHKGQAFTNAGCSGELSVTAMLKNETWVAEGGNELFNRQLLIVLLIFFSLRKLSSLIMVLFSVYSVNRVPFVSQSAK